MQACTCLTRGGEGRPLQGLVHLAVSCVADERTDARLTAVVDLNPVDFRTDCLREVLTNAAQRRCRAVRGPGPEACDRFCSWQ